MFNGQLTVNGEQRCLQRQLAENHGIHGIAMYNFGAVALPAFALQQFVILKQLGVFCYQNVISPLPRLCRNFVETLPRPKADF